MVEERERRRLRIRPAAADGDDALLGLEHVARAREDERALAVGDREHRLERRSIRSVRQSFASSTAERRRFPWCFSSFASKRSKSVNASAVAPAKPARMRSW
jgi:hypothetical protein